jgi:hypothetical protein
MQSGSVEYRNGTCDHGVKCWVLRAER